MNFNDIFFNEFGRVRSGWRFALFLLSFIFFGILVGGAVIGLASAAGIEFAPGTLRYILVNSSISLVLALALGWLWGKSLEDLPFRALGAHFTKNWFKDLIWGLIFGAFSIALAIGIAVGFGGLSFEFNRAYGSAAILLTLGVTMAVFAVAAAFEEALFRGYILQTFARAQLAWLAIVLTSVFFALAHYNNPNATAFSVLNTALAGLWLGVAYLKTRNLWFPFGVHLMWNWMQGAFFGVEVSGLQKLITAPFLREIDTGPIWLTGENYGIEGGIACTIALIVSTAAIHFAPFLKPTDELLALTSEESGRQETVDSRQ
jgi:membrane protease YdiL (CAAX protease family)